MQDPLRELERNLYRRVRRTCEHYELLADGDRILVAISGGKDSYTMLELLSRLSARSGVLDFTTQTRVRELLMEWAGMPSPAVRELAARGLMIPSGDAEATVLGELTTDVRAAVRIGTSYTVLASHHSGCDGTTERLGCTCNAAIKRFCQSQGHTSGYGPIESSGDYVEVFCVFP